MSKLSVEKGYAHSSGVSALDPFPNFFMKQTRKGCLGNCLGCEQPTEIKIATLEHRDADRFYAHEESACLWRFCCPAHHPFKMNLTTGAAQGGDQVATYERDLRCLVCPCKCCCYQEMQAIQPGTNTSLGTFKETMWFCVPTFHTLKPTGELEYVVHYPMCCGCFVDVCAEGCCSCRIPMYIFPPGADGTKNTNIGKMVKIWGSWSSEITGAHQFEVEFPVNADANAKARLVGATFLLNEIFFKHHKNDN